SHVVVTVSANPPGGSVTRVEESDSRVTRGPTQWSWGNGTDSRASGNAYVASATAGVTLTLAFTGTGISVIGTQESCSGQARVQGDENVQTIDAYGAAGSGGWQKSLYSIAGLTAASHTLTLTVLGTKQAA